MSTAVSNQNLAPELKAQTVRDRLRLGRNFFWTAICVVASFLTLIPLFSIVFLVVSNGIGLLTPSVLVELPPAPGQEGGGLGNAIQGTALMVGIALLIAAPLGILSAIYISEYDKRSALAGAVRFIAKLLTGIPSIICGMFAFATIVVSTHTKSAVAGGVALAVEHGGRIGSGAVRHRPPPSPIAMISRSRVRAALATLRTRPWLCSTACNCASSTAGSGSGRRESVAAGGHAVGGGDGK